MGWGAESRVGWDMDTVLTVIQNDPRRVLYGIGTEDGWEKED
jgi:hypothetical protein